MAHANRLAPSVPSDPIPGPGASPLAVTLSKQASLWDSGHMWAGPVCSDGQGPDLQMLDKGKGCSCWREVVGLSAALMPPRPKGNPGSAACKPCGLSLVPVPPPPQFTQWGNGEEEGLIGASARANPWPWRSQATGALPVCRTVSSPPSAAQWRLQGSRWEGWRL